MTLSRFATKRLQREGIDPAVAVAVEDLSEVPKTPGDFNVFCRRAGWPLVHRWSPGDDPEPWPNQALGLFWPVGKGASVLLTLGAGSGLAVASELFRPDENGNLHRPEGLPAVLGDVVPACLPETAPGEASEWIGEEGSAEELFGEVISPELRAIYLALLPAAEDPALVSLVEHLEEICDGCDVLLGRVSLPWAVSWGVSLQQVPSANRIDALAGALELARQDALDRREEDEGA